jgi:5-methylcytosine-specific restriction endonuclease McrA
MRKCLECRKEYQENKKEITRGKKKGNLQGQFCSLKCGGIYTNKLREKKNPNVQCALCGKEMYRPPARLKTRSGLVFCGVTCQHKACRRDVGLIRLPHYIGNITEKPCAYCGNIFKVYRDRPYCSHTCACQQRRKMYIDNWLSGNITGAMVNGELSSTIRTYLIEQAHYKCSNCGWDKVNATTGHIPLTVNHKDGNCRNHKFNNLEVLCPNCHSLTSTYGSLNKGSGRAHRRKDFKA